MIHVENAPRRRGRPPEIEAVRTLAARCAPDAIAALTVIAADPSASHADRVAAARTILEHAAARKPSSAAGHSEAEAVHG